MAGKKEKVVCSVCKAKNVFPKYVEKKSIGTIYSKFCPEIEKLSSEEIANVIQECSECGFTFLHIDERLHISKKCLASEEYRYPFGEFSDECEDAKKCFRVAYVSETEGAYNLAAQYYLYTALLLQDEGNKNRMLKQCFILLDKIRRNSYYCRAEIILGYLNVMRLLRLFDCVKEIGEKYVMQGIDKKILEAIIALAERKDSTYKTYFEMLI